MCRSERGDSIIDTNRNKSLSTGQVIAVYRERYLVEWEEEKRFMEISGRFRYLSQQKSDYPQIGDFVYFHMADNETGIIESVQERRSVLERADVGSIGERQILAANIDLVLICMSLNQDFHPKKLRDFLTLTYGGRFEVIILLTKKDICPDPKPYIEKAHNITNAPVYIVSAYDETDIETVQGLISDKTAVCIGASGVGKSTMINELLGEDRFVTKTIRLSDDQGHHATVGRELVKLPRGGAIIDTPGIRIVSSFDADETEFADIIALAEGCLYRDCTHTVEPGCMVQKGIEDGLIDIGRYEQYRKALKLGEYNRRRERERKKIIEHKQHRR